MRTVDETEELKSISQALKTMAARVDRILEKNNPSIDPDIQTFKDLAITSQNQLAKRGIYNDELLLSESPTTDFSMIRGVGKKSLKEIESLLIVLSRR